MSNQTETLSSLYRLKSGTDEHLKYKAEGRNQTEHPSTENWLHKLDLGALIENKKPMKNFSETSFCWPFFVLRLGTCYVTWLALNSWAQATLLPQMKL